MQKKIYNKFLTVLIITAATITAAYNLHKKETFHVDEIFSYAHANSNRGTFFDPKDNSNNAFGAENLYKFTHQWYDTKEFNQYLTVQPENRFNYQNPVNNLKKGVHPPLFYILLHTVSSFTPQKFSKYQAGIMNLLIYIITLIMLYKLARKTFKNRLIANLVITFYGFSNIGITSVVFLRMYALQTLLTTGLVYETICLLQTKSRKHLWRIFLWSALNILTQYNSLIFSFILTAIISLIFLLNKQYKTLIKYDFVMLLSALILFIFFMPNHSLFQSHRSNHALSSLSEIILSFDNTMLWIESITYTLISTILTPNLFSTFPHNQTVLSFILSASAVIYALKCQKDTTKTIPYHKIKKTIYMLLAVFGIFMPINTIILTALLKLSDTLYSSPQKHLNSPACILTILTSIMMLITYFTMPYMGSFGIRYYMFLMPLVTILTFKLIITALSFIHLNNKTITIILLMLTLANTILADFKHKSPFAFRSSSLYRQLQTEIKDKPVIVIQQGLQGVLTFYERMALLLSAKNTYIDRIENTFYEYLPVDPSNKPDPIILNKEECAVNAVEQMKQHPDAVVLILKTPTMDIVKGTQELIDICPSLKEILTSDPYIVLIGEREYFIHHIKKDAI